MIDRTMDCVIENAEGARPLHAVRPSGLTDFLNGLPPGQTRFLRDLGFRASAGELAYLPGEDGIAGAVLGLGTDASPYVFGGLATRLPEGSIWTLVPGDYEPSAATLGFCLGAYRYDAFKRPARDGAMLALPPGQADSLSQAAAAWMVRDLINTPANILGPMELAGHAAELGRRHGADVSVIAGQALEDGYPAIATVGRGSARPPAVAILRWRGSGAHDGSPLVSLCGKGVCFDTGGYDLKPSAGMLRMKKDMGGAATVLGLARLIIEADLPVRLVTRVGCVENSVSGTAMRPSDVIRTRSGQTVEVGNTDAEGRLVLCDLLTDASDEAPAILIDCATLTGAARVALGPDLPAMFSNDDSWAHSLLQCGTAAHDPVWRLPLWAGYDDWLKSNIADMNNVSSKPLAGAIIGALFLQRFVGRGIPWIHLDLYAWNDSTVPGRPEGGEAQALRSLFAAIRKEIATI
jgi:leucyl aminopeptidase